MANQYVILKIVENFRSPITIRLKIILISSLLLFAIGVPTLNYFVDYNTLYKTVAMIVFIILYIFAISYSLSKKTRTIGSIELTETTIKAHTNEQDFSEELSNINQLEFKYKGYEGETIYSTNSMISRDGDENYLTIKTKTSQITYHLFIDNEMQVRILDRLFLRYRKSGTFVKTENFDSY